MLELNRPAMSYVFYGVEGAADNSMNSSRHCAEGRREILFEVASVRALLVFFPVLQPIAYLHSR